MLILNLENTELLPSFFFRKDLLVRSIKKKKKKNSANKPEMYKGG